MAFNAHLIGFGLDAILQIVSSTRKSGAVTAISEGWGARLFFRNGRVVYASSDARDRFGHRLIQRGLLNEQQLREALEAQAQPGEKRPLATFLCANGVIARDILEREVTEHVVDVVRDMLSWSEGSMIFEPLQPEGGSIVMEEGLSIQRLLLRAASTDASSTPEPSEADQEFARLVGYTLEENAG